MAPLLQLRFSLVRYIFPLPHAPRDLLRVYSVAWSGHKELGLVGKPGFLISRRREESSLLLAFTGIDVCGYRVSQMWNSCKRVCLTSPGPHPIMGSVPDGTVP